MRKAITVTEQNKANNPKYLGSYAVGNIVVFTDNTFPIRWYTGTATIEGFKNATDKHEVNGFYEVVTPAYDSNTQYLGNIFFNVDVFTYTVEDYTQEELDAITVQQENQQADSEVTTKEDDGQAEIRYIFRMLKKLQNKGTLTLNQYNQSRALLFDALLPMYFGQWDISQTKLNAITPPANQTLNNILTQIKDRVAYYLANDVRDVELKN